MDTWVWIVIAVAVVVVIVLLLAAGGRTSDGSKASGTKRAS